MNWSSVPDRILRFDRIREAIRTDPYNVGGRIGSGSAYGETHEASVKGVELALKFIPVSDSTDNGQDVFREVDALNFVGLLVEEYVNPNLPLTYDVFAYPNQNPTSRIVVANELASGDLKNWTRSDRRSIVQWKSCVFQILAGLTALEEYAGILHRDLHWGNVLYTDVPSEGCWHYRYVVDETGDVLDFYPINAGQLWRIWDFGSAAVVLQKTGSDAVDMMEDVKRILLAVLKAVRKSPALWDAIWDSLEGAKKTLADPEFFVPAFSVLFPLAASWFPDPSGEILNAGHPYTVVLSEKRGASARWSRRVKRLLIRLF